MTGSAFAAEILEATASVDAVMAEPWQLLPRKAAAEVVDNVQSDAARPEIVFLGTYLSTEAKPEEANSYDRRQVRRPGVQWSKPSLLVSASAQAAMSRVQIANNDLLLRLADGRRWSVSSSFMMPGGTLRLHINLVG